MYAQDLPPAEELRASFPFDLFLEARRKFFTGLFWLNLRADQQERLDGRVDRPEEDLEQLALIWRRIGEDRITFIDEHRQLHELAAKQGLSGYTLGNGEHPDLEEIWRRERDAEVGLAVDFKSLFVFGEIVLSDYLVMSEVLWEAPADVAHSDGPTKFLNSVMKLEKGGWLDPKSRFGKYMAILREPLRAVDDSLGFYRDKFVIHLPPDMFLASGGGALGVPLDFEVGYARERQIEHRQLERLCKTVKQIEHLEGLDLGGEDPQGKLRTLSKMLDRLSDPAAIAAAKNILVEFGAHSPPALTTASNLANLLEMWGQAFIDDFGVMTD